MSALLHIASFVVQHRPDAAAAVAAAVAATGGADVALQEGSRSVVLCEGGSEREVVNRIEALRDVDGVLSVSLIHHHAESKESMLQEVADDNPS